MLAQIWGQLNTHTRVLPRSPIQFFWNILCNMTAGREEVGDHFDLSGAGPRAFRNPTDNVRFGQLKEGRLNVSELITRMGCESASELTDFFVRGVTPTSVGYKQKGFHIDDSFSDWRLVSFRLHGLW